MAAASVKQVGTYVANFGAPAVYTISVPAGGVAVGNTVVVFGGQDGPPPVSVTDSRGNTYVKRTLTGFYRFLYDATITTALQPGDLITITRSDLGGMARWFAHEFSGLDRSPFGGFNSNNAGTAAMSGGVAPASIPEGIAIGLFRWGYPESGAPPTISMVAGTGYTLGANQVGATFGTGNGDGYVYKVGGLTPTEAALATLNYAYGWYGYTFLYTQQYNHVVSVL